MSGKMPAVTQSAPPGHGPGGGPLEDPAISMAGVQVIYRRGRDQQMVALEDTNLEVGPREFVSLLGPSGCGKTTLLKVIGGLVRPTRGKVSILGSSIEEALKARRIGFVFQDANLLPWRTTWANACLLAEIIDKKSVDEEGIRHLLDEVGLTGFEDAYPRQLSGGMKQRVGIVRALAFNPGLLLMDEPFAALDALTRDRMAEMLLDVWGGARPVVFVTHSIEEAAFLSDRVVVMSARPGRVLEEIEIDLPRPRTREMRDSAEFVHFRRRLREVVDQAQSDERGA